MRLGDVIQIDSNNSISSRYFASLPCTQCALNKENWQNEENMEKNKIKQNKKSHELSINISTNSFVSPESKQTPKKTKRFCNRTFLLYKLNYEAR